ncbi:MAG: DNA polymerase I [Candidatus Polarisedimenticolia bacterium]
MGSRLDPERTVYLVDGTNNLFRAFHAIRDLRTSEGLPTNAVFGFVSMLRKLLKEHRPRYLAVAFDRAEPTFRHRAFADYKAHRPEVPPDLIAQIPWVKRACEALSVPMVEAPGYEADDLIGTLAGQARRDGYSVVIVATDKDLLQLVGDGVVVFNPVREEYLDEAGVERSFGVRPVRVRDVLALCGDASDNIPGVPGIGEKGAKDLVRAFGDLDAVLAAAPDLADRLKRYRDGLLHHEAAARLSLDLATLRTDAPVAFDPAVFRLREAEPERARALFTELEFRSIAAEFAPAAAPPAGRTTLLTDAGVLEGVARRLREAGLVAVHIEGDDRATVRAGIVGIALAAPGGESFYVPTGHLGLGAAGQLDPGRALGVLRAVLEDPGCGRVGDDIKNDLILLRRHGIACPGFACDTMLAGYLMDPGRRSHALEDVAREFAGLEVPAYASILGDGARRGRIADVGPERVAAVLGARAAATLAIRERLSAALEEGGLHRLFTDLELPLASVLADMEMAGVRIDTAYLRGLAREWERELERLTAAIHAAAGREFNINSPAQLRTILFEELNLTPGRKTRKTRSFSTDQETLEELARRHELPRLLLEYRGLQKLKSTYVDSLPALLDPRDGRIHTSFNQAVAATGRLSSSDPNLQNIPVRTETGRLIRRAFIPEDGAVLLSADYSQIELRVLAHLCGDPALVEAFRAGEDIHRRTAAEVFGVMPELVTDEMRRRAKVVNFGVLYGMGAQRLAREQGIRLKEAQEFIERYFRRLPRVKEYLDAAVAAAEKTAQVHTLFGRVRHLPEIRSSDRNARQQAIRAAVNSAIQGTAADLIKKAMVVLDGRLRTEIPGARMILQVHDELVLEVRSADAARAGALLRETMESVHPLAVPLRVDLLTGPNWLDLEPLPGSKD